MADTGSEGDHSRRTGPERPNTTVVLDDVDDPEGSAQAVLDALDDRSNRTILGALDDPRTARELADRCDVSTSTVYRTLGQLSEAGLVEERTLFRTESRRVTLFVRVFESIRLTTCENGLVAEMEQRTLELDGLCHENRREV